jgi:manganese oxidase
VPTESRDNYLVICAAFAGFALLSAVVAIGFGVRAIDTAEAAPSTAGGSTVSVPLAEFTIGSGAIEAAAGDVLAVTNDGSAEHDLEIVGTDLKTPMLAPGEAAELSLAALAPGEYDVHCTVPGHESAGMTGTLTVTDSGGGGSGSGLAADGTETDHDDMGHGAATIDFDEMDAKHAERTLAFPAETESHGGVDLEPTILDDGTKRFELTVEQVQWEVEPGKFVDAMAYNGMVPGPTIRGEVGDDVEIVVTNEMDESTAVHWHGILVPNSMDGVPDITQEPIRPGETFTYAFPLREPAVGMYHSHHNAAHQVPDGLAGAFLVGEMPSPDDVEIAQEIPMMLNDAGTIGFSINGKSFPATEPIVAEMGERIMVHYLNEGLVSHPMHLHGMWQMVVAKDGAPLETPYLADTIDVAPGERYSVIVDVTEPGVWAWHCHILTHAESSEGMFGMVTALITEEADA